VFDCRATTIGCREKGAHYGPIFALKYFEQNVRTLGRFARAAMYRPGLRQGLRKTRQGRKSKVTLFWPIESFACGGGSQYRGN
jgi:hypothetical protein